ncbi:MAG TPA: hypothetical protein VFA58_09360 [Chthoniobacterales bacterium]|nr:hypothetical protein [Chthoniobacterales bacterium]
MKVIAPLFALLFLTNCQLAHTMLEQPGDRAKRLGVSEKKSSALLEKQTEVFTGKVVLEDGAYRFEPVNEPGTLLKLTRARRESEFEAEQILLRKYYEKTITVKGTRKDDWIWGADITGQYVPPGGATGPNMNAPKQSRP